jgi:hypothetical protein
VDVVSILMHRQLLGLTMLESLLHDLKQPILAERKFAFPLPLPFPKTEKLIDIPSSGDVCLELDSSGLVENSRRGRERSSREGGSIAPLSPTRRLWMSVFQKLSPLTLSRMIMRSPTFPMCRKLNLMTMAMEIKCKMIRLSLSSSRRR